MVDWLTGYRLPASAYWILITGPADAEDAAAKAIVKKPVAVYIEKVYKLGDFSGLGIGT